MALKLLKIKQMVNQARSLEAQKVYKVKMGGRWFVVGSIKDIYRLNRLKRNLNEKRQKSKPWTRR